MGNDIAMEVFEKSNFKNNNYVFIDKQEANKFKDDIVVPNDIIRQLRGYRMNIKTLVELFIDTRYYDNESCMDKYPYKKFRYRNAIKAFRLIHRNVMTR